MLALFVSVGCAAVVTLFFFSTYVSIFLESSKTDQFRDGAWVAIARPNQDTCPVKALEQYIAAAKIDLGEGLPSAFSYFRPNSELPICVFDAAS